MIERTITSGMIWVCTTVIATVGRLRGRDLWCLLGATTLSTLVVWRQPADHTKRSR